MTPKNRLLELLSDQATQGLDITELSEMDRLLAEAGMKDESKHFELSAAAMDLASNSYEADFELPGELRDKVLIGAGEFLNKSSVSSQVETASRKRVPLPTPNTDSWRFRETIGWLVAAACLVIGLWLGSQPTSAPEVTTVVQCDSAADKVDLNWQGVHNTNVSGKIVWSDDLQAGYMVFDGLPTNDPNVEQYQLWIFDTDKGQEVPIDGGVFDITSSKGSSTVLFKPTHPVKKGVQFAVTIEIPGGVQRSDRSRLPVLASLPDSNPVEESIP